MARAAVQVALLLALVAVGAATVQGVTLALRLAVGHEAGSSSELAGR